jgi:hypothetical protein
MHSCMQPGVYDTVLEIHVGVHCLIVGSTIVQIALDIPDYLLLTSSTIDTIDTIVTL